MVPKFVRHHQQVAMKHCKSNVSVLYKYLNIYVCACVCIRDVSCRIGLDSGDHLFMNVSEFLHCNVGILFGISKLHHILRLISRLIKHSNYLNWFIIKLQSVHVTHDCTALFIKYHSKML